MLGNPALAVSSSFFHRQTIRYGFCTNLTDPGFDSELKQRTFHKYPVPTVTNANGVVPAIQARGSRVNLPSIERAGHGFQRRRRIGRREAMHMRAHDAPGLLPVPAPPRRWHAEVGLVPAVRRRRCAGLIVQAEGRLPAAVRRAFYHRRRRGGMSRSSSEELFHPLDWTLLGHG